MNISKRYLGLFFITIFLTVGAHWYYMHYLKGQFVPELIIAFVIAFIAGIGLLSGQFKVKSG